MNSSELKSYENSKRDNSTDNKSNKDAADQTNFLPWIHMWKPPVAKSFSHES